MGGGTHAVRASGDQAEGESWGLIIELPSDTLAQWSESVLTAGLYWRRRLGLTGVPPVAAPSSKGKNSLLHLRSRLHPKWIIAELFFRAVTR
jgi:hypothetical protein